MLAVKGIYDGKVVRLLEPIAVEKPCQVEVTFLAPLAPEIMSEDNLEQFIGMWADLTPEEDRVFRTIFEESAILATATLRCVYETVHPGYGHVDASL